MSMTQNRFLDRPREYNVSPPLYQHYYKLRYTKVLNIYPWHWLWLNRIVLENCIFKNSKCKIISPLRTVLDSIPLKVTLLTMTFFSFTLL